MIEKITMRQIQDEYYKVDDHAHPTKNDSIVPPTPLKNLPFDTDLLEKSDALVNGEVATTTVRKQNTATASASAAGAFPPSDQSRLYESP
ncbi:MAG: hypothetical protein WCG31_09710 [Deltaproteobacteria bacterium]